MSVLGWADKRRRREEKLIQERLDFEKKEDSDQEELDLKF